MCRQKRAVRLCGIEFSHNLLQHLQRRYYQFGINKLKHYNQLPNYQEADYANYPKYYISSLFFLNLGFFFSPDC